MKRGKLYYLTRTFYPYQNTGGALMRKGMVDFLEKNGWEVEVILPNYGKEILEKDKNVTLIPYNPNPRLASVLERIGFLEDYLEEWVQNSLSYLKDKVTSWDIFLASTGGDLGSVKLGALLKRISGGKFVVNYRDPINYTHVLGQRRKGFHISRDKFEKKYLQNVDLVITSSRTNLKALQEKYSFLRGKIYNVYFGYLKKVELLSLKKNKDDNARVKIVYSGAMTPGVQGPEILYYFSRKSRFFPKIELYFIGNWEKNRELQKIYSFQEENVIFKSALPHQEYLDFMMEMDIGFVSLVDDYYSACVPSKIYEYINLALPILAALPQGDAFSLIERNGFGYCAYYKDLYLLQEKLENLFFLEQRSKIRSQLIFKRDEWAMEVKIKEIVELLDKL